jgi:hypothetical protein
VSRASDGYSQTGGIEVGTSQNSERKQVCKGNLHPIEHRGKNKSGQRKKVSEPGLFTGLRV